MSPLHESIMKQTLIYIALVLFFASCKDDKQQLKLIFDNTNGLTEESPLLINGFQIGQIDRLELTEENRTLVIIDLIEKIEIPKDSKFEVEKTTLFGDASINLKLGESETLISIQDTIYGTYSVQPTEIEKGIQKVIKNVIELTDSLKEVEKK